MLDVFGSDVAESVEQRVCEGAERRRLELKELGEVCGVVTGPAVDAEYAGSCYGAVGRVKHDNFMAFKYIWAFVVVSGTEEGASALLDVKTSRDRCSGGHGGRSGRRQDCSWA